jgi:hypothetical protein
MEDKGKVEVGDRMTVNGVAYIVHRSAQGKVGYLSLELMSVAETQRRRDRLTGLLNGE